MPVSFEQWRDTGEHFQHGGHSIFYQARGSGDGAPLLLIHGFPTASWDWHRIWPQLCARFSRVIAPDMIGFGYSAKPRDYAYAIRDQADLHEELLRQFGVERYHVLAHDYGDTVAQELLARHLEGTRSPELLSICFLNGGLFPETHRARFIQKLLASPLGPLISSRMNEARFRRSFSVVFGPNTQPSPQEMSEFWRLVDHNRGGSIAHKLIGYMAERRESRERWVGALVRSAVPLRVIDGAADPVSGAHVVARYRELVPNPDTISLEGIGHYPQIKLPRLCFRVFSSSMLASGQTRRPDSSTTATIVSSVPACYGCSVADSLPDTTSASLSENALFAQARRLAGRSLAQLAEPLGLEVPPDQRHAKGWVGQLLEKSLGATAGPRAIPDFAALGVELKTLPVDAQGVPRETTFVATLDLSNPGAMTWERSTVRCKLARVLWIPVEAEPSLALRDRRVGMPLLWSPSAEQEEALRTDFEEIADLIGAGFGERVTGRTGRYLQLRPKGANGAALRWAVDAEGAPVRTAPRAFYLRRSFTTEIVRAHYQVAHQARS